MIAGGNVKQLVASPTGSARLVVFRVGRKAMRYALATSVALLALAGCEEPQPRTVAEFMENEIALYGTLERCERQPSAGADDECRNARQAAERIAAIEERAMRKGREQAFESAREEYRARLDRERDLRQKAEAEAYEARQRALSGPLPEPAETAPIESGEPEPKRESRPNGAASPQEPVEQVPAGEAADAAGPEDDEGMAEDAS